MAPPAGNRQAMATLVRHEAASFSPPTVRYKRIEYPLTGSQELVDLESDPTKMHYRAKDPELRPSAEGLQRQLALLQKQYGDNKQPIRTRARVKGPRVRPQSQARGSRLARAGSCGVALFALGTKKRPALVQRLGVCEKPRRRPTFSQSNIIGDFRLTTVFGMGTGMARSP